MFYTFRQNNSGGFFAIDDNVTQFVFIEADSADDANDKAESIGIYFDGCEKGLDCDCCGDRWSPVSEFDGGHTPMIYGDTPQQYLAYMRGNTVICRVFYTDGTIAEYMPENQVRTIKALSGPMKALSGLVKRLATK